MNGEERRLVDAELIEPIRASCGCTNHGRYLQNMRVDWLGIKQRVGLRRTDWDGTLISKHITMLMGTNTLTNGRVGLCWVNQHTKIATEAGKYGYHSAPVNRRR